MRVLHTSDWHLGHTLHTVEREHEHRAFLSWLLDQLAEQQVDALLICGDVFDTANPSAASQRQWYGFLASARERCPALDIVVIGGNHDSGARLDAPGPLLEALRVQVRGNLDPNGDPASYVLPLTDSAGAVAAWVAAVPFLRPADLPRLPDADDPLIAGVALVYERVLNAARDRREPHQALIALGHAYLSHTAISDLSERRILGGNQHALPAELFPADVSYAALGHLHLAQKVGREHIRYCGSPIPLSMSELAYKHQVLLVDLDGPTAGAPTPLFVPRVVELLRVPATGALPLAELEAALAALPPADDSPRAAWPLLEARVLLSRPEPDQRARIDRALVDRRVRLVRIDPTYTGTHRALGGTQLQRPAHELRPDEVLALIWERDFDTPPTEHVWTAFRTAVELADQSRSSR